LKSDRTVWGWGFNGEGELGDGTTTMRLTPIPVGGLTGVLAIAGGETDSLFLKGDGTVWGLGRDDWSQLGDGVIVGGGIVTRLTPVQASGLTGVVAISAGYIHSLALKSDGTVWKWGSDSFGNNVVANPTPVPVGGLAGMVAIAGGLNHSLALKSDGTIWAWGRNLEGQLGDGSMTNNLTPVLVTGSNGFSSPALRFVPITPCRIADSRRVAGPFGGPSIAGGASRDFAVPDSTCSIPATALAYSLNVAVVPSGPLGFLTMWPAGQTRPVASTLNSVDGRVKSNAAIVPAGTAGAVSVFASNATNVVLDINGYFVDAADPTALAFYPITPCRVADTRIAGLGLLGTPSMGAGQSRTFPVRSSACNIPPTALAYSLNFTAVPRAPLGFLTTWPTGQAKPEASSLNAPTGTVTANAAIVPAGASGSIDVFASNPTDLVIDINGYFAPMATGGLSLYGVTPCRVADTRQPTGSPPIIALDIAVGASACGIPVSAQAYVLSLTVVPPGPLGFLTLWPQGQALPTASTLNATDGAITSNMAIVPTTNGSISAFPSSPTHLILDISGYFGH